MMECQYCFQAFDLEFNKPLHMQEVKSSINAPICEYCKKYMIKKNVDKIVIRNQPVYINRLHENIPTINKLKSYCKLHNQMVKTICADHYEFQCKQCNHHRTCRREELTEDTVERSLDNKIKSTFRIDNNANLYDFLKIDSDQEIPDHFYKLMLKLQKDYEDIMINCRKALNSKSLQQKKDALEMAAAVKDIKIDKLKSFNEFFKRVLFGPPKKPKPPASSMIPGLGSAARQESESEDEFPDTAPQKIQPRSQSGPDPDIYRVFDQLRLEDKLILRLFYQKKIISIPNFKEKLIIVQDLYESFPVLGLGFGTCINTDYLVIKRLIVSDGINEPVPLVNTMIQKHLNSVVSEVHLPEPISLTRKSSLSIEIEIEAYGDYYCFMTQEFNGRVGVYDFNGQPYPPDKSSLILYIF